MKHCSYHDNDRALETITREVSMVDIAARATNHLDVSNRKVATMVTEHRLNTMVIMPTW